MLASTGRVVRGLASATLMDVVVGSVDDVTALFAFLASEEAGYITATTQNLNGVAAGTRQATNAALDRLGALLVAATFVLLAWRTVLGSLAAWETQSGTMILGFPEWVVHASMAPPMALAALIALSQATGSDGEAP